MPQRRADVRDRESLVAALEGSDVVYNLAAVHRDDVKPVSLYNETNVGGAINVCEACRELQISQVLFTSSVAVYALAGHDNSEESTPEPFNAYGQSKLGAEKVYRQWQAEEPDRRSLVIVRPSVVFGEDNRGNVYQLVRQIMTRRFLMVGAGQNRKSMAYVGNLSSFLVYALKMGSGVHLFNYADCPDLTVEELVSTILLTLGRPPIGRQRIPYIVGYLGGVVCDAVAAVTGRRLPISAVRVRKFSSNTTVPAQRVLASGFRAPIGLREALVKTIIYEVRESGADGTETVT